MPDQCAQTKRRRRMLAGAEAESGIQHDDRLIFARQFFAPARFDEQSIADLDGFEMPLPRFRPIFAPDFRQYDFAGADFQPAMFDSFQAGKNFPADCSSAADCETRSAPGSRMFAEDKP